MMLAFRASRGNTFGEPKAGIGGEWLTSGLLHLRGLTDLGGSGLV